MLGWRAEVMAKRGSKAKNTYQIKVFGHWFELGDTARIMPVKQLEEQEESGEEEEEEEGEEEEDSSDDDSSEDEPIGKAAGKKARVVVDSSDEEGAHLPKKARAVDSSDEEGAHLASPSKQQKSSSRQNFSKSACPGAGSAAQARNRAHRHQCRSSWRRL